MKQLHYMVHYITRSTQDTVTNRCLLESAAPIKVTVYIQQHVARLEENGRTFFLFQSNARFLRKYVRFLSSHFQVLANEWKIRAEKKLSMPYSTPCLGPLPPPLFSLSHMLLAKHSQLQAVNCLISPPSISPNKDRWRSGTKVMEQGGWVNNREGQGWVGETGRGIQQLCLSSTTGLQSVVVWMGRNGWNVLKILNYGPSSSAAPPTSLQSTYSSCLYVKTLCWVVSLTSSLMFECDSFFFFFVPHGQLNEHIFKMTNIWSFLIGQFFLPTCVVCVFIP